MTKWEFYHKITYSWEHIWSLRDHEICHLGTFQGYNVIDSTLSTPHKNIEANYVNFELSGASRWEFL